MKTYLLLLFSFLLPAISSAQKSCIMHCDPKAEAAMDYLQSQFGDKDNADRVWMENEYDTAGRLRIERRENRLEKLAVWADTLKPEDRQAYLGAIEDYEDGEKEAYSEWHTHDTQDRMIAFEKHEKECREEARKVQASKDALPKPPKDVQP